MFADFQRPRNVSRLGDVLEALAGEGDRGSLGAGGMGTQAVQKHVLSSRAALVRMPASNHSVKTGIIRFLLHEWERSLK